MAQYNFTSKKDIPTLAASSFVFGSSLLLQRQIRPLSLDEINNLDVNDVNRFDRYACTQWNQSAKRWSDVLAIGSVFLPTYFVFNKHSKSDAFEIVNVSVQSLFLSQSIANMAKLGSRNRPFLYNPNVELAKKMTSDAKMSFFSAHTTTVASTCYSFAFAFNTYNKESKAKPFIWAGAAILPAIEGILRVKAGKHYASDVIVGYLAGLGSAWLMHRVHLK